MPTTIKKAPRVAKPTAKSNMIQCGPHLIDASKIVAMEYLYNFDPNKAGAYKVTLACPSLLNIRIEARYSWPLLKYFGIKINQKAKE